MVALLPSVLIYITSTVLLLSLCSSSYAENDRPVIGILTVPNSARTRRYVAGSYVKWLEAAGARSIPIPYEIDEDEAEAMFHQVNGVLFPGGSDSEVPKSARKIWQLAKEANDNGDVFPIWGTCLGFEYIVMLEGNQGTETLQHGFNSSNVSLPLLFTDHASTSRMYADDTIREIASNEPVTMNNHNQGIEPTAFTQDSGLTSMFHILSTNVDLSGRPFVSTFEGKKYPFYGVQFHPEKNAFEYGTVEGTNRAYQAINHSSHALAFSLYLARFFVDQARLNRGGKYTEVEKYPLVWSYDLLRGVGFEQEYIISTFGTAGAGEEDGPDNEVSSSSSSSSSGGATGASTARRVRVGTKTVQTTTTTSGHPVTLCQVAREMIRRVVRRYFLV